VLSPTCGRYFWLNCMHRVIFIASIFYFLPCLLLADNLHVAGINFHVDEIIPVDDSHSQVTVFGETRIVANTRIEDFVLEHYLRDLSNLTRFSPALLFGFVRESWVDQKSERAALGLNAALLHPQLDLADFRLFFDEISQTEGFYRLFQKTLEARSAGDISDQIVNRMVYEISLKNPEWILRNPLAASVVQKTSYTNFLRTLFMEAVERDDIETVESMIEALSSLHAADDERLIEFRLALERYNLLSQMGEDEMMEVWYPDPEEGRRRELVARVSSTVALRRLQIAAESMLEQGNAQRALQILARMDLSLRTPTTHDLVFRALQRLPLSEDSIVLEPSVAALLSFLSINDERIRLRYSEFLERQIYWLLEQGKVLRSEYYFNQLLVLRPDPNSHNDRLRLKEAITWAALGRYDNTERILSNIRSSPGLHDRVQLFRFGYYIDLNFLILLIGIPLIVAFSSYLYWKSRPVKNQITTDELSDLEYEEVENGAETPAAFSLLKINRALNPRMQEYRKLLSVFGLGADSSLQQIKAAYRTKIKEVHPDLQFNNLDSKGSESFIQIKKDYERIVELRTMLGFGRE